MRVTLEDLRLYYNDRRSDMVSAIGVGGLAFLLMGLANATGNGLIALIAIVNAMFVWVPLGGLWQKKRLESQWREAGLDSELLGHCEKLSRIDWSLDEYVDTVLSVYTTIANLSAQNAWFRHSGEFGTHLSLVREGLLAFFQRVERVDELRRMYDMCAESMRRPGRLASLQARVDREYKLLESFADAFEGALLDFSEAMAASMSAGGESAMTEQLQEFAGSMRRLSASLDEMDSTEALLDEELDEGARFDRLLGEHDAMVFDEPAISVGGGSTAVEPGSREH
ncbi:MAG: hypothetical protein HZB16_06520 [Armatimonadetes bacterium]|nr:hypothetical protein [Armatimonadota bacterium]